MMQNSFNNFYLTRLTRLTIAGATRTPSPHNPLSPPSLQFRTNINSKGF